MGSPNVQIEIVIEGVSLTSHKGNYSLLHPLLFTVIVGAKDNSMRVKVLGFHLWNAEPRVWVCHLERTSVLQPHKDAM